MQTVGSPWPDQPDRIRHPATTPHRVHEDILAILIGTGVVSVGIMLLSKAELSTGGTVGLSLLLARWTGSDFGLLFLAVNLPFYLLSFARLGWMMAVRTAVAVVAV